MKNYKSLWEIYDNVNRKLPFKVEWRFDDNNIFIITINKVEIDGFRFKENHVSKIIFGGNNDYLRGLSNYRSFKLVIRNEYYLPPWF